MESVNIGEVRERLADLINRVAYSKDRIVLKRRGKDIAVIVSMEDLALLEELEDRLDAEEAQKALREFRASGEKAIPLDEIKLELLEKI
jgi:prevent-host-death family protein